MSRNFKKSMADYRSNSYNDGNMQIEPYYGPHSTDIRSYSFSHASSSTSSYYYSGPPPPVVAPPQKLKKGGSIGGSISKSWSFADPELQRKKRVASYKVYSVEGKIKGSFRKSFRWIKDRYTQVLNGWG